MRRKGSRIADEILREKSKEEYFLKYIEWKKKGRDGDGRPNISNRPTRSASYPV